MTDTKRVDGALITTTRDVVTVPYDAKTTDVPGCARYDFSEIDALIEGWPGDTAQCDDGVLQSGTWILYGTDTLPNLLITEDHVNCWTTVQVIRELPDDKLPYWEDMANEFYDGLYA